MPVEYPQVILAIKQWIGQHKVGPAANAEIDGQPASRKSSGAEMLSAAFKDAIGAAVTGGIALTTGGTEGFNKYLESLPDAVKEPLKAMAGTVGKLTDSLPTSVTGAFSSFKDSFINPIGDSLSNFRESVTGNATDLHDLASSTDYATNPGIGDALRSAGTYMGTTVKSAIDAAKSWSDGLTLGTGDYTLKDAISDVNSASTNLFSQIGITSAPSLTDVVGIVTKDHLTKNMESALVKEKEARGKDLNIPENYDSWVEARDAVYSAAADIQDEVNNNKATVNKLVQEQTVLDGVGDVANTHAGISDPEHLAVYEKTIRPDVLSSVKSFNQLKSSTNQVPSVPGVDTPT